MIDVKREPSVKYCVWKGQHVLNDASEHDCILKLPSELLKIKVFSNLVPPDDIWVHVDAYGEKIDRQVANVEKDCAASCSLLVGGMEIGWIAVVDERRRKRGHMGDRKLDQS